MTETHTLQELTSLADAICTAAYKGKPPEHVDFDDIRLYHAMKSLYREFSEKAITKEEAETQKRMTVQTYIQAKRDREQWLADIREMNDRIEIGQSCNVNLHKCGTLAEFAVNAAKLAEALTGDVGLVKLAQDLAQAVDPFA